MKQKLKRILAVVLIIFLLFLYGSTIYFAFSSNPNAPNLLKASIYATIIIPVLLYAYHLIYRALKNRNHPK